ncbi:MULTISPECIES: class I SAM-dependent methyltransferase [Acinetobacter]|uniref:class I SAM-dependent methyltransferase n=1 Tax=Acinetobacter TaxID=469 RepID=UPI00125F0965|nr:MULTISPECIES: class I SAM-dependent methyltransferase [Acinetobacter]MBK5647005.1 class I SAM-dependent methyltransferase [Acinetobacter sp.]MCS4298573.1 ubiquinone/menaquinone biosynthesis C-methylase UbiE [Acinetobacter guillouiae]MCW2252177.1 ubiquinone/menaquinone biosynthesis C-methylase UbiE [Acinetobacter sp. BIGb0204]NII38237.1 ubiquinone/menaquinone biosynthesis C-methylase UbiE [Acinetobacter sp. BIGb0196]
MIYKFYQQRIFPHLLNQVMQTPSMMDGRAELLGKVRGEVLEIGFGTGLNLPFYQEVDQVYALEPNRDVYQLAQKRVFDAPFHVQHIQASAEKLPFADHSVENIVSTWTMCSIANLDKAIQEIYRVLKPQGTLHLIEHVQYHDNNTLKKLQDLLTPIQKVIADGCHLNRNIELELLNANFKFSEKYYFDAEELPKIGRRMFMARAHKL